MADLEEASRLWSEHYALSEDRCTHQLLFGRCRGRTHMATPAPSAGEGAGGLAAHFGPNMTLLSSRQCDAGLRRRTYCILSGSVLTVWPEVEKQIPSIQSHKLQIVRLKTDDGKKYIGEWRWGGGGRGNVWEFDLIFVVFSSSSRPHGAALSRHRGAQLPPADGQWRRRAGSCEYLCFHRFDHHFFHFELCSCFCC